MMGRAYLNKDKAEIKKVYINPVGFANLEMIKGEIE